MQSSHQFWRIRGVPPGFARPKLAEVLRDHPGLRLEVLASPNEDEGSGSGSGTDDGDWIRTLASDLCGDRVATICFPGVPMRLLMLDHDSQLVIDVSTPASEIESAHAGTKRKRESAQGVGLTIDRHFQGITTLFAPDDGDHEMDILAVSGLGDNAFESFVNEKDGHMWLSDSLPQDVPKARVMIYGYKGGLQHGTYLSDLEDHACSLQAALSQLLQSKTKKPLILIGHSLGGLFIKEALIRIANSSPDLMGLIFGVLFFGVPNEGLDIHSLPPMANKEPTCFLFDWMSALTSPILRLQEQNFSLVLSQTNIEMFCFYETGLGPTAMQAREPDGVSGPAASVSILSQDFVAEKYKTVDLPKYLVSPQSATSCLPPGASPDHSVPIDRSHSELVRFYRHDLEYGKVADVLERMTRRLMDGLQTAVDNGEQQLSDEQQRSLLDSLHFDQMDVQQIAIKTAYPKTGKWFLENPAYLEWLTPSRFDEYHGFLWIKSKPGAGRSTLMRFILPNVKKIMKKSTLISFFFNAYGCELERSTVGMYRSLLFQLLKQLPRLRHVFNSLGLATRNIKDHQWTVESLKLLFEKAIRNIAQSTVTCFIDAMGECDEAEIQDMASFFANLGRLTLSKGSDFRVCFSSRQHHHITIQNGLGLVLEGQEGHQEDINQYLNAKLRIGRGTTAEQVRAELREKAGGVFLWTVLVVQILNKDYEAGRAHTLRQKLRELPEDLPELFRRLLTDGSHHRDEVFLCIQLMLFARQPLSPQQLYSAIILGTTPEALVAWDSEVEDVVVERFILDCSRNLVEVTKSNQPIVQFIHESVREFLNKRNGAGEIWPGFQENFEGHSHEKLKQCCYKCMTLNVSEMLNLGAPSSTAHRRRVESSFPFMKYAVRNLLYHADRAKVCGIDQDAFVRSFPLANWIAIRNLFEEHETRRYTEKATLLYILAENDLSHLIKSHPYILSYLCAEDERYGTPLFAALASGSDKALGAFLTAEVESKDRGSAYRWLLSNVGFQKGKMLAAMNFDFKFSEQNDVMSYLTEPANRLLFDLLVNLGKVELIGPAFMDAAKNGDEKLFEWLLEAFETNVELTDGEGRTAFSLAAANGHEAVMHILLRTPSIAIDLKDKSGRTPLSWAAGNGHRTAVKLLLDREADVDSKDHIGQTPLGWAARNGHVAVVELLLETETGVNSKDHAGQTPLIWAAINGHKDTVRVLLATPGAYVSLKSKIGCQLLLLGTGKGYEAVVRLLLDKNADVNSKTDAGQTPLIWAAINGHKVAVQMLLAAPGIDVNLKDKRGRTSLSWAAFLGYESIVKLLLKAAADVDSEDDAGHTPLILAIIAGHKTVAWMLLAAPGIRVNFEDKNGRTPLSWASSHGQETIVMLLLDKEADANSKDHSGQTPLIWAAKNSRNEVVSLLLGRDEVMPDVKDGAGRSPLSWAAASCKKSCKTNVVLLLETGRVDLNSRDDQGRTPLSYAAELGNDDVVEQLVTTGVEVDLADSNGWTPLFWACSRWEIAQLLIDTGRFNLNLRDCRGRTLLSLAAERGTVALVKLLLLTEGVCVDSGDDDGRTPLSWAARPIVSSFKNTQSRPLVLAKGSHFDDLTDHLQSILPEQQKKTRLTKEAKTQPASTQAVPPQAVPTRSVSTQAVSNAQVHLQDYQMQLMLLEQHNKKRLMEEWKTQPASTRSVSTQAVSNEEERLQDYQMQLMLIEQYQKKRLEMDHDDNSTDVVRLLLADNRVDPDSKDHHGRSPLSYAAEHGRTALVKLLLATEKVNPDSEDKEGRTPLWHARNAHNQEIVKLLSSSGTAS